MQENMPMVSSGGAGANPTEGLVAPSLGKRTAKPVASEHDIADAKPGDNLRLGGGLYLWVTPKGAKYFQVRLSVGGKGTTRRLGSFPEMDLALARKEAASYHTEVARVRREKRKVAFKSDLINAEQSDLGMRKRKPCFLDMESAGEFIRRLISHPLLQKEIRQAIWLQLLIPARPAELLFAKWDQINQDDRQWTVGGLPSFGWDKPNPQHSGVELLSSTALQALEELHVQTGGQEHVFPSLAGLPKKEQAKKIGEAKELCKLPNPFELNGFREFFRDMACKHSGFRKDFIDDMLTHKPTKSSVYGNHHYNPQKLALAEWWGQQLSTLRLPPGLFSEKTQSGI